MKRRQERVAMPVARRPGYVRGLLGLLRPGAGVLLESYTFDQGLLVGPPFSVPGAELRQLFSGCAVRVLEHRSLTNDGRYPQVRLQRWWQTIYAIRTPSGD